MFKNPISNSNFVEDKIAEITNSFLHSVSSQVTSVVHSHFINNFLYICTASHYRSSRTLQTLDLHRGRK